MQWYGRDDGKMKKNVYFGHPQSLDRAISLAIEYQSLQFTQQKSHLNYYVMLMAFPH